MTARRPIRAVLLDMGGVLLAMSNEAGLPQGEADAEGRAALLAVLRSRGGRVDEADLDRLLFAPWRAEYGQRYDRQREADWAPHLARLLGATGARVGGDEILGTWFGPYGAGLEPVAGAAAAVHELAARGYALGLVSNVALPGALYRERLAAFDMATPFRAMRFSCDAGSRKPAPAMLISALAELGAAPEEAVMVGDRRKSDVAAGRAAGTATVWIRSHHADGPEPDATVDALGELTAVLPSFGAPAERH